MLVNSGVATYPRDEYFGKQPAFLPRTLVLQAEPVQLVPIKGSHFVLWTSPACFASATRTFLSGRKPQEGARCIETVPQAHIVGPPRPTCRSLSSCCWHSMQVCTAGVASSRASGISLPHSTQMP
jgi:hypothetical protein